MHVDDNQIIPTLVCVATIMTLYYYISLLMLVIVITINKHAV